MSYKFLEDDATADVAFQVEAQTLEELFKESALALTEIMVKLSDLQLKEEKEIFLQAKSIDLLLFDFLNELVFLKDSEQLLFKEFEFEIDEKNFSLKAKCKGQKIDYDKHELGQDVKALTFHNYKVAFLEKASKKRGQDSGKHANTWTAYILVDV